MTSTEESDESKPEKIKFFFQKARIPLWERGNWPIITYNETIVWARRFGAAAEFATEPETRSILQIAETGRELSNRSDSPGASKHDSFFGIMLPHV